MFCTFININRHVIPLLHKFVIGDFVLITKNHVTRGEVYISRYADLWSGIRWHNVKVKDIRWQGQGGAGIGNINDTTDAAFNRCGA